MPTKVALLWPANGEFIGEKEYIEAKLAAFNKTKANRELALSPKHVKQLIAFAKDGEQLDDDQPKQLKDLLESIGADYEQAKENQKDRELDEAKAANRETKVLEASLALDVVDRNKLSKKFEVGSNYVTIKDDATDEEIAQQFAISVVMADFSAWAIGDLANALQDRGLDNVIDQFCANTGRSGSTIYGHMRLARTVAKEDRDPNILPTVYKEIVFPTLSDDPKKDAKIKGSLIKKAIKENWNSKEARANATEAREVPAEKKGNQSDPAKKAEFLVIAPDGIYLSETDPGWSSDTTVINLKNRTVLVELEQEDGPNVIEFAPIELR